jgi:hypothetical protein
MTTQATAGFVKAKAVTATGGLHASRALPPSVIGPDVAYQTAKSPRPSPIQRKPNEKTSLQRGEAAVPHVTASSSAK